MPAKRGREGGPPDEDADKRPRQAAGPSDATPGDALEALRASNAGLQRENRGLQQSLDELNQNEGYLLVVVDSMLYDLENHGELKEDSVEAWTILQRSGYLQAAGC